MPSRPSYEAICFLCNIHEILEDLKHPGQLPEVCFKKVNNALPAIASDVIPHGAVVMQKFRMCRHMTEPPETGIQKMACAVN